jgi:hypothetical protein
MAHVRSASRCVRSGILLCGSLLLCLGRSTAAQTAPALNTSGNIMVDGKSAPYMIRHLPVSSFPNLPQAVRSEIEARGCLIPQTYEAHHPENVAHGSLQRAGSADWALLCSIEGTVSLMVFFGDAPTQPLVLASAQETEHLQRNTATGVYGFNWAIDPASPERVHDAATGQRSRPPMLDHDALADSIIDRRTVYHFYANNAWTLLDLPEK